MRESLFKRYNTKQNHSVHTIVLGQKFAAQYLTLQLYHAKMSFLNSIFFSSMSFGQIIIVKIQFHIWPGLQYLCYVFMSVNFLLSLRILFVVTVFAISNACSIFSAWTNQHFSAP